MSCKINSIEQRYRETNPTLADKLTDIAMNAWQSIKDSGVFQKEGLSYVFNAPNTKKRIEQDKVVDTINATQPTPFVKEKEGKVSVNALLLDPITTKKSGIDEIFKENPELSNIGTPEQYSKYLDTIFPDSKVEEMDNSLYISVLNDLKSQKIIDKQC